MAGALQALPLTFGAGAAHEVLASRRNHAQL